MAKRNRYKDDESEVKQKLNFATLRRLFKYVIPHKKKFIIGLILLFINIIISLIWPKTVQWAIDDVLSPGGSFENNIAVLITVISVVAALMIADVVLSAIKSIIITKLGYLTVYDIRKDIFNHLQELSFRYFDERSTGKVLERVTTYVNSLANLLSTQLINIIVNALTLVFILVILLYTSVRLTLISFAVLIPLIITVTVIQNKIKDFSRRVRAKSSNRSGFIHESIMGISTTQSFSHQDLSDREFDRVSTELNNIVIKKSLVSNLLGPSIEIFSNLGKIVVYALSVFFIANNTDNMSIGALTAFVTYLANFWAPITSFVGIFEEFASATSNIERIFETIDTEPEIRNKKDAIVLPEVKGKVEYKDVSFYYEEGKEVLNHISFTAEPGEMIAFVGPTGSGKTSIVNLLSRFYDVCDGSVEIDGHDVRDVTLHSLRTQIGVIMQDSYIFAGTVLDNIRYGRPTASDEECIKAAELVYAADFIREMPKGFNTFLTEGGDMLSEGEKQLISFARIIISNPRILILDEATSKIDTHTEILVQRAINKIIGGRTSFVIAHRLSTIKNADKIMCIADHRIAESGNHKELMQKKGIYYNLNISQLLSLEE